MVYSDTNSTLAGAIAASKLSVKLIQGEAGLRSRNMIMPEENYRILTDLISDLLFCPMEYGMANSKLEGFDNFDYQVINSGDIIDDVSLQKLEVALKYSNVL